METAMDTQNENRLLTATKIVGSYLRNNAVGASQLPDLITTVHRALDAVGRPTRSEEPLTPAVPVRHSVRHDYVVCLDCGYQGKTLRRHLNSRHGLSREEYLRRWGLVRNHPLTAPAYSERRSTMAKDAGLGRRLSAAAGPVPTTPEAHRESPEAPPRARHRSSKPRKEQAEADAFSGSPMTISLYPIADFCSPTAHFRSGHRLAGSVLASGNQTGSKILQRKGSEIPPKDGYPVQD
jgi:predicted transcriptional regulator